MGDEVMGEGATTFRVGGQASLAMQDTILCGFEAISIITLAFGKFARKKQPNLGQYQSSRTYRDLQVKRIQGLVCFAQRD